MRVNVLAALLALGATGCSAPHQRALPAPAPSSQSPAAPLPDDPLLVDLRIRLEEARAAQKSGDHSGARTRISDAIEHALTGLGDRDDGGACALLEELGTFSSEAGELHAAEKAQRRVLEVRTRTLPEDHHDLQVARLNLARTIKALGDLSGARALLERSVVDCSRTLPDDHPDLQAARASLAGTLATLGDLAGARELDEKVLEVRSRSLPDDHPDLQEARLNLAGTIEALGDLGGARALEEQVLKIYLRTLPDDHADLQRARGNLAGTLAALGDLSRAQSLQEEVLEVESRTLPDDHPDLQAARGSLAATLFSRGDLAGSRVLAEKVLEVELRTLPEDHPYVQEARNNLAATRYMQGDLAGARVLQEKVLEVDQRTLPDDHADLQTARRNLALTTAALGDLAGARQILDKVLEVDSRTLPDDHPNLQATRAMLAGTLSILGEFAEARVLQEKVIEVDSRMLPDDHPSLQEARLGLARTVRSLGDLAGARSLEEKVLEVDTRTLPDDHPGLQHARQGLASTLYELGDFARARVFQEKVLEVDSRTLPESHPDLQAARSNLASTISALGDLSEARSLEERVLEVLSRTLPDDHPSLQAARNNLAGTLSRLGELASARALEEKVLEVDSRTLTDDHFNLQGARLGLAATMLAQGELAGARALQEKALEVFSRTLPDSHPLLQVARNNLAGTLEALGDLSSARALLEKVLEVDLSVLPDEHPGLQTARRNLAWTIGRIAAELPRSSATTGGRPSQREGLNERCTELVSALCRAQTSAAREALLDGSVREAQARCELLATELKTALGFAEGCGVFGPIPELDRASFVLSETTRGAALSAAALMRQAAHAPECFRLREDLREQSHALARLAQSGSTSAEFRAALERRDAIQRDIVQLARAGASEIQASLEFDVGPLAARLAEGEAAVGFRRYDRTRFECATGASPAPTAAPERTTVTSLCAIVVMRGRDASGRATAATLKRVELGPIEPIEGAVSAWREAIGAGLDRGKPVATDLADLARARGVDLRKLVFDPLVKALGDADRVVLVLDDVLNLVPIEALPLDTASPSTPGAAALVGERWRIETRCTLSELLSPSPSRSGADVLVALGGASFNSEPLAPGATESAEIAAVAEPVADHPTQTPARTAAILRGGSWERGFAPLTYTGLEAREVASVHDELFEKGRSIVLEKRHASREALEALAPQARWLHIATHGWFARESIRSWKDPEPIDRFTGLGARLSSEEQVKGMSPMLLCGLALAGANLPEDAVGRAPGLLTAEELSTLDLTHCELALLSACDTNVGERRAGQGVASLQMALQMAGARSVITSLWKVPDEATRELMTDFYKRMWANKEPKWRALWDAKMRLRDARDDSGRLKYSLHDWAGWVLTGEPD